MIDKSKRYTLKTLAVGSGTLISGALTVSGVSAALSPDTRSGITQSVFQELGQIEIATRLSAVKNELELLITNTGNESVLITQMTPAVARVARGEFDFSALLKDGPLHLRSGESVTVPMQHKPVHVAASVSSLSDVLNNTMSVITDSNSFASVTIAEGVAVAV